jgi:transcription initiation factor TFIID subunit TAF12
MGDKDVIVLGSEAWVFTGNSNSVCLTMMTRQPSHAPTKMPTLAGGVQDEKKRLLRAMDADKEMDPYMKEEARKLLVTRALEEKQQVMAEEKEEEEEGEYDDLPALVDA